MTTNNPTVTTVDVLVFKESEAWKTDQPWFRLPMDTLRALYLCRVWTVAPAGHEDEALRICVAKAKTLYPDAVLIY